MRKIEREMIEAIKNSKPYKNDNTEVYLLEDRAIQVYLHNNLIAEIKGSTLYLSDCGYQTKTTKSRLNAILDYFNIQSTVYSKNYQWYLGNIGSNEVWTGSKTFDLSQKAD